MNWIKCSDRLPGMFENVLVYCFTNDEINYVFTAYISAGGYWTACLGHVFVDFGYIEENFTNENITHWMPIDKLEEER